MAELALALPRSHRGQKNEGLNYRLLAVALRHRQSPLTVNHRAGVLFRIPPNLFSVDRASIGNEVGLIAEEGERLERNAFISAVTCGTRWSGEPESEVPNPTRIPNIPAATRRSCHRK